MDSSCSSLSIVCDFKENSVHVNTRPLARGDLILPADQLILNTLSPIGNLKFKKIRI